MHTGARYIVTQRSKPKAVLLGPGEEETLEVMADCSLLRDIRDAREDIIKGWYQTYEDYFKEPIPEREK